MMKPNVAIVLTDIDKKIKWVNHDFTLMTGYNINEVIGKKPSILQGKNTDVQDVTRIRENLQKQEPFKDSILNYAKNGREYKCEFVIYPIFDKSGKLQNFIAFEVDASNISDTSVPTVPLLDIKSKYTTSSLKSNHSKSLFIALTSLIQEEKLYLDPDLTLKELANRMNTNTRYLSQVVNSLYGKNLQKYINSFRLEEVKKTILTDEFDSHTIYGIAQNSGFKNKSTFFKVFKEIIGVTPKEYIKQYNKNS